MSNTGIISRETKIVFQDNVDWYLNSSYTLKMGLKCAALMFVLNTIIYFSFDLKLTLAEVGLCMFLGVLIMLLYWVINVITRVICHHRLKSEHLKVKWVFNEEAVTLEDALGTKLTTPWALIKGLEFKKKAS